MKDSYRIKFLYNIEYEIEGEIERNLKLMKMNMREGPYYLVEHLLLISG